MNPAHHHHGVTISPLPIGMVTAHGAGGPVGIGIGVPLMTSASIVPSIPSPQQPQKMVPPDSADELKDILLNPLNHRTPSPNSGSNPPVPVSVNGNPNSLPWANHQHQHQHPILQPMAGMGYPVMGMGVMGPPPAVLSEPGMLYSIISAAGPELNMSPNNPIPIPNNPNGVSVNVNLPNGAVASPVPVSLPVPVVSVVPNGVVAGGGGSVGGGVGVGGGGPPSVSQQQPQPQPQPQQQQQLQPPQPAKEIIHCKSCTLFPPNPSAPPPTTRDKPPGCRTVFVGGLPENVTDDIVREIFERCGEITTIRMSKKNFCHIRFELESFVENGIYLSGYRVRIGSNSDAANIGRLHVDYAQARDDLYEWECRERKLERERRHRERIEQERLLPPSPPPVVHYSEHEAVNVSEKLKVDETFIKAVQVLITWLDRGDCTKRNSSCFYSMIQSTNSHVRRLLGEKSQYDDELNKAKELMRQRMQGLLMQFSQIEKVFLAACHKKAWDHFTKAQRKNIDVWKKQAAEIKNIQLEEALNERTDEEMELSDSDSEREENGGSFSPRGKKMRVDDDIDKTVDQLKEENDSLRCQLEAFKNEVDLIKADLKTDLETKDSQIRELHRQLLESRRSQPQKHSPDGNVTCNGNPTNNVNGVPSPTSSFQLNNLNSNSLPTLNGDNNDFSSSLYSFSKSKSSALGEILENCDRSSTTTSSTIQKSSSSSSNQNDQNHIMNIQNHNHLLQMNCTDKFKSNSNNSNNSSNSNNESSSNNVCNNSNSSIISETWIISGDIKITETEARLIGIISTFLHVHPFGASLDYIWSYAQKVLSTVRPNQLEALMSKFPSLFRQQMSGVGATLERKWIFVGFS